MVRAKNKIGEPIIGRIAINMMDNLSWFQVTAKMFFHDKAMFINVTSIIGKRMIRAKDAYISVMRNLYPTLPFVILGTFAAKWIIFRSIYPIFFKNIQNMRDRHFYFNADIFNRFPSFIHRNYLCSILVGLFIKIERLLFFGSSDGDIMGAEIVKNGGAITSGQSGNFLSTHAGLVKLNPFGAH